MKSLIFGLILFTSVFTSSVYAQSITVQSPNGGETWTWGGYEVVTWTGENLSGLVSIEFSSDGGANWFYLASATTGPNGGSTLVGPPNVITTNALLKITRSGNPVVSDVSDAPFTNYVPPIVIFQPYAGMAIFVNDLVYIYWTLTVNDVNWLNAEISLDNGQTYTPIAENINAVASGTTFLELSDIPSESCILKLYNAEDPSVFGLSEVFSINPVPVYTLTSPAEGDIINTLSPFTITWNVVDPYSSYCYLEYSVDNGINWMGIDNAVNVGNSGSYDWVTPNTNSDECLIRINDSYAIQSMDLSGVFSVLTFPETPVCMVTVDSLTNYNIVVWEKPVTDLIADFLVFKETDQTNVYEVIDTVAYEEASLVTDYGSNPAIRPYRYKIGFLDNANREFPAGDYHQTIHLTINQGVNGNWNLIWTPYVGFEFASYYIVRKSGSGNYEDIATVSASFNSYTDFDAPDGDVSYMVKIVHPTGCDFTLRETGYPEVYSNAASNSVVNVSENRDFDFDVFPNPANDLINLVFGDKIEGQVNVIITDLAGRKIYSIDFRNVNSGQMQTINSTDFEEGLYLMHLQSGEKGRTRKIVVRH
jgi:hypothetical protein